ncbi:hypothetical protein Oweho_3012 [Owenweeksia hongkongensis DSM 17368]|uniref:Lipoprotein n=1 Tax=Owenweeksia hongkongensis (strain DSM 17368 / CIP 108786 / JCM 12287 / NRRL B-23963 / UST20020801) TaxID=926562 RepID=G8R217_OWEHD|nr:hypothetical protein [Owenweeksia hongkongensis]AEV33967.1 hypothetical protein Oweho_3012 [Owenweeksia hongkongensis DSM 17368]
MKRIFIKWFVVPLFLWMSVGCKYYQYRPDLGLERWEYQSFDTEEWRQVDARYCLVLHYDNDTVELFDVTYHNSELSGSIKPFAGLPLEYFKDAVDYPGENIKRPFGGESGPATNQIHFFLDGYTKLGASQVKFVLYHDVRDIDFVKQSPWNFAIGGGVALGSAATGVVLTTLLIMGFVVGK